MPTLARCEFDLTDELTGALLGNATVRVVNEVTGGLPQVYSDRAGTVALGNPFPCPDGRVGFHVAGGVFRVTSSVPGYDDRVRRYVAIGRAAETDLTLVRPMGLYSAATTYGLGDMVSRVAGTEMLLFVSLVADNLNHTPDSTTPGDTAYWMYAGKAVTGPAGSGMMVAISDEVTAITAGTGKLTFRAPNALALTAVKASLTAASSSGLVQVDINVNGVSILSTKLTIDAGEKTSVTAATAAVISSANIADDDEISIDIDSAGTGAKGLKVTLVGGAA
jgi:hypothetical protein